MAYSNEDIYIEKTDTFLNKQSHAHQMGKNCIKGLGKKLNLTKKFCILCAC